VGWLTTRRLDEIRFSTADRSEMAVYCPPDRRGAGTRITIHRRNSGSGTRSWPKKLSISAERAASSQDRGLAPLLAFSVHDNHVHQSIDDDGRARQTPANCRHNSFDLVSALAYPFWREAGIPGKTENRFCEADARVFAGRGKLSRKAMRPGSIGKKTWLAHGFIFKRRPR